MGEVPPTPESEGGFDVAWVASVAKEYLEGKEEEEEEGEGGEVTVTEVTRAARNEVQGILSTTFVVDFNYTRGEEEEPKEGSIFVKVPLKGQDFNQAVWYIATFFNVTNPCLQMNLSSRASTSARLPCSGTFFPSLKPSWTPTARASSSCPCQSGDQSYM